ncbi:hypothetical protein [Variovorax sp. 22077]|uniref:hypothetical protein n=1 Tax=Variovorax sp. 22077 TaxID=3453867 RepID=UPI003F83C3C7
MRAAIAFTDLVTATPFFPQDALHLAFDVGRRNCVRRHFGGQGRDPEMPCLMPAMTCEVMAWTCARAVGSSMRPLITIALLLVGIIHLLPLAGVMGATRLTGLYGIVIEEPNLEILMRHRAVLFGLLGAFFCYAAFQPQQQALALVAGFVSVGSFLLLSWMVDGSNAELSRVFVADVFALALLVAGGAAFLCSRNTV